MLTGLGATETSPFFMCVNPVTDRSGHAGLRCSRRSRWCRTMARWKCARAEHHAGLLARAGTDREGVDEEKLLHLRRCTEAVDPDDLLSLASISAIRLLRGFQARQHYQVDGPLRACVPRRWCAMSLSPASTATNSPSHYSRRGCRVINPDLPAGDLLRRPMIRSSATRVP